MMNVVLKKICFDFLFKAGIILSLCQLSSYSDLYSQINESDTLALQVRAALTGAVQKGNVDLMILRGRLESAGKISENIIFKTQNNTLYQEFSGFIGDNDLSSRNYIYYNPLGTVYPFGIAYIETNLRRRIDLRIFAGAGITYQIFRSDNSNIKISGNIVYENSDFSESNFNLDKYDGMNSVKLWRGTIYFASWHNLAEKKVRIFYSGYWQPGLSDLDNFRTRLEFGADFNLVAGLNFTVLYNYTYENLIVQNVKPQDNILTFGVSYNFKMN